MGQDNSLNKKTYICEFCHKEQKRTNRLFHQKICKIKYKDIFKKANNSFSETNINSYKDLRNDNNNSFNNINNNTERVNNNYNEINGNKISNNNKNNISKQIKNINSSNNTNINGNVLINSNYNNTTKNTENKIVNSINNNPNKQRIKINNLYKYGGRREISRSNKKFNFAPAISSGQAIFNYIGNSNDNNDRNVNNNNSNNVSISQNHQNNNNFIISSFALSSTAINNYEIRPENPDIKSRVETSNNNILFQLPENKIEDLNNLHEENKRCIICLEEYNAGDITIVLPCFHFFHKSCMINWYKRKAACPLCKLDIKSNL